MNQITIRESLKASWKNLEQLDYYIDRLPETSKLAAKKELKSLSFYFKQLQEAVETSTQPANSLVAIAQNSSLSNADKPGKVSKKKANPQRNFTRISHCCLQLSAEGTIINCYMANNNHIQPRQFLGWQINDLLPLGVANKFLQAIAQVSQTQQLTTFQYSLPGSDEFSQSAQFYEVKLIPWMKDDRSSEENLERENQVFALICNITEQQQEWEKLRQEKMDLETFLEDRTYALRLANEQLWETMTELQDVQTILENQTKELTMRGCAGRVGIWDWNLAANKIYVDPILKSLLGYSDAEIGSNWDDWQAKIYPEDIDRLKTALSDYTLGEAGQFELEYRMFHKDGTLRWFLSRGTAIKREKLMPDRLIGSNTDITEEKVIKEALKDSEERFGSIFNQAAIGIAQVALNGVYLQVNQKLCDILGYSQEELLSKNFLSLVYREDVEKGKTWMKALVKGDVVNYCIEQRYLRSNRQLIWTDVTGSLVRNSSGQPKYFIQVIQDISDRRKAEFALKYSEARYQAIVNDQIELVCRFFPDGTLIFINHAYADYFGQSYQQLIGTSYLSLLSPEERQRHQDYIASLTPENPVTTIEYTFKQPHRETHWQQWNIRGFFDSEGKLLECQGVGRDISDRVQAEAERDRFFSLSLDLLCIANFEGYFKRINAAWTTTLGYDRQELLAQPFLNFIHPHDHAATILEMQKLQAGIPVNYFENRYLCRNGSYKWIAWSVVPFPEEKLLYAVGRDITDQKQVEIKIKASLEEKDVLLKEIHHRVKNNLQIVCSLLELQSQCSQDTEVMAMFKESQGRIRSMSLVHETLYQSNDLGHLDFSQYLREISLNLCTSYGYGSQTLKFHSDPKKIFINLDTAIQCGLILNELLTNAFKYAFSDKKAAKIYLGIRTLENDSFLMIVEDNGIGLAAGFQVENTETLGWRVIRALTRKLKGEIKIRSDNGTQVSLRFSKIKQKSAQLIH